MTSLFQPKAAHFLKFLTHSYREGYVHIIQSKDSPAAGSSSKPEAKDIFWIRRYFVLKEGKLTQYLDEEHAKADKNSETVLLSDVTSVRTKPSWGSNCFEVEWNRGKVMFKVKDKEQVVSLDFN